MLGLKFSGLTSGIETKYPALGGVFCESRYKSLCNGMRSILISCVAATFWLS